MNKIFLDTNVLVSAIDTTRKNHKKAIKLIEKIKKNTYQAFISTQIVGEFYVSLTRNFGGINAPLSPDEARKEIEEMLFSGLFIVLPVTEDILRRCLALCSEKDVIGVRFWDVVIIATMLENKIPIICTENLKDFRKFEDLVTVKDLGDSSC
ncbi:PIN domain-containing protein [Thermodesulfatator autotrophicus]|uniref:Ribonuclease VapC n=1 Tax=Thermodesulfatator autotrophicus TaxID=1795632 RepID=A0A177E6C4_9BACT|nr:PIN domain-containing protein [Thermodesulfatator autotrophicus]OAG27041.1 hypothetical protein TH606_09175 [Thermodesulfatator autotrophicus]